MDEQQQNARRSLKRPSLGKNEQTSVEEKDHRALLQLVRPTTDDRTAWGAYWQEQNQPWRTEPEISPERRAELEKRRALVPDVEKGIYPFKGMKLDRADVEWLLATYDVGPVKWSDEKEREREGLDVRGADLQHANLHQLPLTRLHGGLTFDELREATEEQRSSAVVLMREADLSEAQLEGANLSFAQLEGANLSFAQLEGANLSFAQLEVSSFNFAQLEGADLGSAQLEGANLGRAQLKGGDLSFAQLEGADLFMAQLEGANLRNAQLKGANLGSAQLEGANLWGAQLEGADLRNAQLKGANLRNVILGDKQRIGPRLADLQWGDTNLAVVDWSQVAVLGDEREARQKRIPGGEKEEKAERLSEYQAAVRANRQLAVALQTQGLNEYAARFAYRANTLQRKVFWYQLFSEQEEEQKQKPWYKIVQQWLIEGLRSIWKFSDYIFSLFLDILAGYGYKPGRTLGWYLLVVLSYAGTYFGLAHMTKLHSFIGAIIFSITAFHGRGFFPGGFGYDDLVTILAATEAVIGLLIELSFIATFTQRFFGK